MTNYDGFFSRAAGYMRASAIRKMGGVAAEGRDVVSFAPGFPAPETFAWHDFQEIAHELLSGRDGSVLQYGPTRGYRPLVEAIAGIMARRGAPTLPERLLVTTGSQQGLDLVARVLLDPHDVMLVELPTYTGAISAFRNVQADMVGVRQEADGIDLAELDDTYRRLAHEDRRARLLYLVPNFQNPTGLLIGSSKRLALLDWAERRDVLIVEDDPYRDLYFEDSATEADVRPIRADDRSGCVIYLSSFSKTLAPGYRGGVDRRAAGRGRQAGARQTSVGSLHRRTRPAHRLRGVPAWDPGSPGAAPARALPAQTRCHGRRADA
jgi:2-aminoadipate transaminase